MILLTGNRRMSGQDALEKVIREENSLSSRPVITISVPDRMDEYNYRDRCASRLVEIVVDLHTYMGVGRVFIP